MRSTKILVRCDSTVVVGNAQNNVKMPYYTQHLMGNSRVASTPAYIFLRLLICYKAKLKGRVCIMFLDREQLSLTG